MQSTHFSYGQHFTVNYIHCKWIKTIAFFFSKLSNIHRKAKKNTHRHMCALEFDQNAIKQSIVRWNCVPNQWSVYLNGVCFQYFNIPEIMVERERENSAFNFWTFTANALKSRYTLTIQSAISRSNNFNEFALFGILFRTAVRHWQVELRAIRMNFR